MISAIRPNTNISPFQSIEGTHVSGIIEKVIEAVVKFFTHIAEKIRTAVETIWETLQDRCCEDQDPGERPPISIFNPIIDNPRPAVPSEPIAPLPMNAQLIDRLAVYKGMPTEQVAFMQKAIDIHRAVLATEDTELPPDVPKKLDAFNESVAALDGEICTFVIMLSIRAFLFTDKKISRNSCPAFLRGHNERRGYVSVYPQIAELKGLFQKLSDAEKRSILIATDPSDIGKFNLSDNGKKILRDINGIAALIVQNNDDFNRTLQQIQ